MKNEYDRIEEVAEARIFALASPVILPIIARRKEDAMGRLLQAHRSGKTDTVALTAELCVLADLEMEITQKEKLYHHLEEKQHGNVSRR